MSYDDLNESPVEFTSPGDSNRGPGARLKRARESAGFSISEIANSLNLTGQIINDLECDDYSHVAGITFARGYLRAYSRLLKLHDDIIMEEFDRVDWPEHFAERPLVSPQQDIEAPKEASAFRYLHLAILLALVIAIGLWWRAQQNVYQPTNVANNSPAHTEKVLKKVNSEIPQIQSNLLASNEELTTKLEIGQLS